MCCRCTLTYVFRRNISVECINSDFLLFLAMVNFTVCFSRFYFGTDLFLDFLVLGVFLRLFTVEVSMYKNVSTTFGLHLIFIETKLFWDFSNYFFTNDLCSMNLISLMCVSLIFVCFSFIGIDSSKIEENIKSE